MRWNLRMKAAEQGIWKSTEMRRRLAEAGLEISAGKMSALWTGTPTTIRLDDLDVVCDVLDCQATDLLIREQLQTLLLIDVRLPTRISLSMPRPLSA